VSTDPDEDNPLVWYEITETSPAATKWTLSLYLDYFRLETRDDGPYEVDRADVPEKVQTFDQGLFLRRVVAVKLAKKKLLFRLEPVVFAAVQAWIGPPTAEHLKVALKRRLGWVTPLGLLFVLAALPIGDRDWEPVSLALGLGLILTARFAKLWPHRVFFAIDALWFAGLAANSVWLLAHDGWSWLRAGLLVLQVLLVRSGFREYRRFAPGRMAPVPADNEDVEADLRDEWDRRERG